jgi:hypothetical protein
MKNSNVFFMVLLMLMASQSVFAQARIGVKGGLNMASMLFEINGDPAFGDDLQALPGFNAGLIFDFPMGNLLSLESGLTVNQKGYHILQEGTLSSVDLRTRNYFLDVPFMLKARLELGGIAAYLGAGPYVGFGLSGRTVGDFTVLGVPMSGDSDVVWGNESGADFKRFDYGAVLGAGIEIKQVLIGLSYGYGIANLAPQDNRDLRNRVLSLSLGYFFE